ncbi:UPF0674 endoplasmic reticulum membrane protein [Neolecta irregularis DAH-3]|uniref:UPF0674 endoplasmic reticulum membrane protein n=1 Tax=Neolecta irregularis (strain DAH-3) TaxID=1198029 RepID=A0A1U7LVN4_NEOID|nr:UPF0674 endoplasmic reticulum membrane protein [Neolecta irregularis DAH-3]|eukprot:OLL26633.1 UPF0674 endoplasmic reticulum membrane protein [Neolecta irregularis DAH-3]
MMNYIRGRSINRILARNWYDRHSQFLCSQFSRVEENLLDGPADFQSFCTGRQNMSHVNIRVMLRPRQDILARMINFLSSSVFGTVNVEDRVFIDIYPDSSKYDGFVWGLGHKDCVQILREQRFDVGFARSVDLKEIGNWIVMFTESAEVGERVWTEELKRAVKESERVLEWVLISDQPEDEPNKPEYECRYRIQLCMKLSDQDSALVEALFKLVDHLVERCHFRPEVVKKLKASREDASKQIKKKYAEGTDLAVKRKVDKEKAEKERLTRMSASEQRKFLEKKQDKVMKKAMNKRAQKG